MGESVPDIDVLSVDDLKKLVVEVFEANAALRAEIAALRDEIARLKGLPVVRRDTLRMRANSSRMANGLPDLIRQRAKPP